MTSQIVTGDDTAVQITLNSSTGAAVNIAGAAVKAVLANAGRTAALTPVYTCTDGYKGASFAAGIVVVPLLGSDTSSVSESAALWEVEVVLGGSKTTYLAPSFTIITRGFIP